MQAPQDSRTAEDEWFASRCPEEQAALRAGALSWPDRKQQRWGDFHWREAGPFDWTGCEDVVVMIGRLSGVPTVGDVRFSADNLLALYEEGESARELASTYLLDLAKVVSILHFARRHGIPENGTESLEALSAELTRDPVGTRLQTIVADWRGCPLVALESGIPVIKGTRVDADGVVQSFQQGDSTEAIARSTKLGEDQVQALLRHTGIHEELAAA